MKRLFRAFWAMVNCAFILATVYGFYNVFNQEVRPVDQAAAPNNPIHKDLHTNQCQAALQSFVAPNTELYAIAATIMQHESGDDSNAVHFDKCALRDAKGYCLLNKQRTTKMGFSSPEEGTEFIYWAARLGIIDKDKLNVGIGCMQVSFPYHFDKFDHWTEAFDPYKNVRAGLIVLKGCMEKYKDRRLAIGCYNTQHPEKQKPYLAKVWPEVEQNIREMMLGQFAKLE